MDEAPAKVRKVRRKTPSLAETKAATRARWREWQRMLDDGVYESKAVLARGEGVSRAAVTQGLRKLRVANALHRDDNQ